MSEQIQKAIARMVTRRLGQLHTTLANAGLVAAVTEDGIILILVEETGQVLASVRSPSESVSQSLRTNPGERGGVDGY